MKERERKKKLKNITNNYNIRRGLLTGFVIYIWYIIHIQYINNTMHVCVWCTHEAIVLKLKEEDEINHIIIIISSLTTLGLLFFDFILKWWSFGNRSEVDKTCML